MVQWRLVPVRVTMRGDMNGDGVCISLALAPASIPGPCPGPGPPGTTGQWAAAPGRGHRRYPPPRPPAQQSDPSCPIATSTSSHTNIAFTANIFLGVENIWNQFSTKEHKIKFIKKVNILVKTSIIELFWRNQSLSRILCLNWLLANKKVFWRLKMSLSIEETQTIQTNYLCR